MGVDEGEERREEGRGGSGRERAGGRHAVQHSMGKGELQRERDY